MGRKDPGKEKAGSVDFIHCHNMILQNGITLGPNGRLRSVESKFFYENKKLSSCFFLTYNVINGILFMCAGPLVLTVVLAICVHLCLPAPNWLTLRPV